MNKNNHTPHPSEDNLKKGSFSMSWGAYLYAGIFWWFLFGGWGQELTEQYGIIEFILWIGGIPATVILMVLYFEILGYFFVSERRKSVDTVAKQQIRSSVYEYTQPIVKIAKPQLAHDLTKGSSSPTPISNNKPPSISTEKILSPENFFSVPRKIDWDELNKTRKYNGDLGELFVYDLEVNYLTKIGRSDLAERVEHVAKEGDGHGYDIKSFYENGSKKYIEVKATNASSGSTFNISRNEFNFLQAHLSNAVIYHVHNINNERETTVVIYPAGEVLNSPNIFPSGYVVKM
jgi:hypothetical protein